MTIHINPEIKLTKQFQVINPFLVELSALWDDWILLSVNTSLSCVADSWKLAKRLQCWTSALHRGKSYCARKSSTIIKSRINFILRAGFEPATVFIGLLYIAWPAGSSQRCVVLLLRLPVWSMTLHLLLLIRNDFLKKAICTQQDASQPDEKQVASWLTFGLAPPIKCTSQYRITHSAQ
jgi:hypothetical protein